jgi:hypothetical protein
MVCPGPADGPLERYGQNLRLQIGTPDMNSRAIFAVYRHGEITPIGAELAASYTEDKTFASRQ